MPHMGDRAREPGGAWENFLRSAFALHCACAEEKSNLVCSRPEEARKEKRAEAEDSRVRPRFSRGFEVESSYPRSLLGACPTFPRFPAGAKREKGHDMCASLDPPLVLGIRGIFFPFSPLSPPLIDPLSWPGEFFDGRIWVGFAQRRGALENGREEEETVKPFDSLN